MGNTVRQLMRARIGETVGGGERVEWREGLAGGGGSVILHTCTHAYERLCRGFTCVANARTHARTLTKRARATYGQ